MTRRRSSHDERFLRYIWSRQEFCTADLRTTDSRSIIIEDAGKWNRESGPDFLDAVVKIDGAMYRGDVEIHKNLIAWKQHTHHTDPRYNRVILHVVLKGRADRSPTISASGRSIPILILESYLVDSLDGLWSKAASETRSLSEQPLPCRNGISRVDPPVFDRWFNQLASQRLEMKLRRYEERLRQLAEERIQGTNEPWRLYASTIDEDLPSQIPPPVRELTLRDFSRRELWDQVMYEGLMEGLGYSQNRQQFLRLSRIVTLEIGRAILHNNDNADIEAVLFGASGLLPPAGSLEDPNTHQYVDDLWKRWDKWRVCLKDDLMHAAEWQFFPTRPSNFPTLRIAAAAALIERFVAADLFRSIIQILKSEVPASQKRGKLSIALKPEASEFWSHRYRFEKQSNRPITALGQSRIDEMIANALIPCALLYARVFRDRLLRNEVLQMNEVLGPLPENSITRLMQKEFGPEKIRLHTLSLHQGAVQLHKFYCSVKRCSECSIGGIVFGSANKSSLPPE